MKFYLISKFPPHVEVAVHFSNKRVVEAVIKILKYTPSARYCLSYFEDYFSLTLILPPDLVNYSQSQIHL